MSIRPIIEAPDPRLRVKSTPVDTVDDDLRTLIADMFETMYEAPGIGLAAIQIGVPKRVLVIDLQEEEGEDGQPIRNPRVFINPEFYRSVQKIARSITKAACRCPINMPRSNAPRRSRRRWLDEKGVKPRRADRRHARHLPPA
jgi:peptide deformylase